MDHITLEKYPTPIPPRGWDWMARLGGEDVVETFYGFGSTELEAVEDLMQQMESSDA